MLQVARLATLGEMAAGIAHEINQPLAAIVNYARACQHFLDAPDMDIAEVRAALTEIGAEALRAGDIIRRLRALVGKQTLQPLPSDLNQVVEELRVLAVADARAHDAQLRLELAAGLPVVNVDRVQIQHVLLSLVRNSLEALAGTAPGGREVVVRTRLADDGEVELSVCDTGPGPAPDIIDRMFLPFSTTKPTGTGLGLAISRTVMDRHGGTIDYRPAEPRGACFYIRLPALEP
jgi:two-component system sensor kinase FixL